METNVTNETDSRILEKLKEWEQAQGQPDSFAAYYRELLQIQSEVKPRLTVTESKFTNELVRDRLHEGIPLLSFEDFCPDWEQVQAVFEQIISWMSRNFEDSS